MYNFNFFYHILFHLLNYTWYVKTWMHNCYISNMKIFVKFIIVINFIIIIIIIMCNFNFLSIIMLRVNLYLIYGKLYNTK
ncbi:MAG: hypothetical protein N7Q72_02350, partial [Spiroplasma sp. Tabriz.8]|nr:hypothetical protein [Spiroplasma sp. Tabriz.8]